MTSSAVLIFRGEFELALSSGLEASDLLFYSDFSDMEPAKLKKDLLKR